ncbi:MAG: DedA family protein [Peptococcaceae bacterium]|nr:DedA family protein [Peptococcaceae bacterium]
MLNTLSSWSTLIDPEFFIEYGTLGLFFVAFAEASFLPVFPDLILIPLALLTTKLALWYALICTAGSVLGALFGHFLGLRCGRPLLDKFFSRKKIERVEHLYGKYGGWAIVIAGFTPLPYKLFTISAGVFKVKRSVLLIASLIGRGARFFLIALLIMFAGERTVEVIEDYSLVAAAILVFLITIVVILRKKTALFTVMARKVSVIADRVGNFGRNNLHLIRSYGLILLLGGIGLALLFCIFKY